MKNSSNSLKKVVFWAASIALSLSLLVFILEKSQIINVYSKPVTDKVNPTESTATVNNVDYSPASSAETDTGQTIKDDTAKQGTEPSTPAKELAITLSAASQDEAGGPVIVRTIISGATGGNCTITMTKGTTVKTFTATIASLGTYYGCNTDIPYSDLTDGTWQLKLVANQNNASGTATEQVVVRSM